MLLKSTFPLLLPLFLSTSLFAATTSGEIRQIDLSQNMAAVKTHGKINIGDTLIATSKEATQCSLTVRKVSAGMATVDTSSCSFASQLRVGQKLEPSLLSTPTASHTRTPSARTPAASSSSGQSSLNMGTFTDVAGPGEVIGLTVFAFYDNSDKVKGDLNGGGQSFSATANSEAGVGIGAEYARYNYRFLGFYGGAAYEFGKEWKSRDSNGTKEDFDNKPVLRMFLAGAGGNFSITNNFYLKAGANYNIPSLSSGSTVDSISGRLGYELGGGMRFLRRFNAELTYRQINMAASGQEGGVSYSLDNLSESGFVLRGGYVF